MIFVNPHKLLCRMGVHFWVEQVETNIFVMRGNYQYRKNQMNMKCPVCGKIKKDKEQR